MTIEERLEKLEVKLARARFIYRLLGVIGIGVFLVTWFIVSRTHTSDVVFAKRFTLVDDSGITRAELAVREEGAVLSLCDENGKFRTMLRVGKDGSRLDLFDENGKLRTSLCEVKGLNGLILTDENQKPRATLVVTKDGPGLDLFDENENVRASMGTGQTETEDGRVTTYPESSLLLFDQDGYVIWEAP